MDVLDIEIVSIFYKDCERVLFQRFGVEPSVGLSARNMALTSCVVLDMSKAVGVLDSDSSLRLWVCWILTQDKGCGCAGF